MVSGQFNWLPVASSTQYAMPVREMHISRYGGPRRACGTSPARLAGPTKASAERLAWIDSASRNRRSNSAGDGDNQGNGWIDGAVEADFRPADTLVLRQDDTLPEAAPRGIAWAA